MCVLYNKEITKGDYKITEFIDKNDNNCGILWLKKNCNPPGMLFIIYKNFLKAIYFT